MSPNSAGCFRCPYTPARKYPPKLVLTLVIGGQTEAKGNWKRIPNTGAWNSTVPWAPMLSTEYKLPSDGGLFSHEADGMRPSASTHMVPAWDTPLLTISQSPQAESFRGQSLC